MGRPRKWLAGLASQLQLLLVIVIAVPLAVVTSYIPASATAHKLVWIVIVVIAVVVVLLLARVHVDGRAWRGEFGQIPPTEDWVDRDELKQVLSALTARGRNPVALTTGLAGAGGFGKTMLAARACRDQGVQRRFSGGIFWVSVGRDADDTGLAERISDLVRNLGGVGPAFSTVEGAGEALAAAVADRGPVLLVADDVWTERQLAPFVAAGASRLLVTTRRPSVLAAASGRQIRVDAVSADVAGRILGRDLPAIGPQLERQLLDLAGGWPLLLSLINRRLADEVRRHGVEVEAAAKDAVRRLALPGRTALDITDSGKRETAVAASIDYSLDALFARERDRFIELGIFPEDTEIPIGVVALLWQATGGLSDAEAWALCDRLDALSLLSLAGAGDSRVLLLHDVVRDFAFARLGDGQRAVVHAMLVDAARPLARAPVSSALTEWWHLPDDTIGGYLLGHLAYHLQGARRNPELDQVVCDLRFLAVRLIRSGPAAAEADLARSASAAAEHLRRAIARNAHLLGPAEPPTALATILTSRIGDLPELIGQLPALRAALDVWTAQPLWPLPDQSSDQGIRALAGHTGGVAAVAVSPDGTWLASGSHDGTVRIWDAASGLERVVLEGHTAGVTAVAVSPDGTWLASGSHDGTVRIWDAASGLERVVLEGHTDGVTAVAVSPDGIWLASGSRDGTVRIWDAASGQQRAVLSGHTAPIRTVAISPDGTWLASGSTDGTVRVWDAASGLERAVLSGHTSDVTAVAVSPDGTWLASGSRDRTMRIWDAASGQQRAPAVRTARIRALAASPDGTWLATGSTDGTVRVWDVPSGQQRAVLSGHTNDVTAVAISPDGTWLASGSRDRTVRIWDVASGEQRAVVSGHTAPIRTVAISPDATWLATGGSNRSVRIWDAASGQERAVLEGHTAGVTAVAISPDGIWLASGSHDRTVRIWDAASGQQRAVLEGHTDGVTAVAISPDATWLATGGSNRSVRIWDSANWQQRAVLRGHTSVTAVAISPDATWLASGSTDGKVRVWDVASGQQRAVLEGHTSRVTTVAVSPDGAWLATGSQDGTVRIWDPGSGQQLAVLSGHTSGVNSVAILTGGTWLASASQDGTVRIWGHAATGKPPARRSHFPIMRAGGGIRACTWTHLRLYLAGDQGLYGLLPVPPDGGRSASGASFTES